MTWNEISLGTAVLALGIWLGLIGLRGQFWRCDQRLDASEAFAETGKKATQITDFPAVCAIVPARNEAELLPMTLRSLLGQSYPGPFQIILVDDQSSDGTAAVARQVAQALETNTPLNILSAQPLPPGWTGKLWALEQGLQAAQGLDPLPSYFLLTDADIEHASTNLVQLVTKAQQERLELVSLMVRLRCESFWEKLLIPAFVFFFQKLYPFRWANDPDRSTAAAAGGCILLARDALLRIGGMASVREALIDDCALAEAVKSSGRRQGKGRIWIGLSDCTRSLRPYPSLGEIWRMVTRTAYTQLYYSPVLLVGTVVGMLLVYWTPAIALVAGGLSGNMLLLGLGAIAWGLMSLAYWPTVRYYNLSPLWSLSLSAIALLYTLMTLDSARQHWQGRGGVWKGRVYAP